MKNAEETVLTVNKGEKKARLSSQEKLDNLKPRLQGILMYRDLINSSDKETQEKLRKEFKREFKTVYSDKLIEKLLGGKAENITSVENKLVAQAEDIINQAATDITKEHEVATGLENNSEFTGQAEVIDTERKVVVGGSIKKAGAISGLSKIMNKILKEYPYFEEKNLAKEMLEPKSVVETEDVDMSKDIPADFDPSQSEVGFEDEILGQRKATLEGIENGKNQELAEAAPRETVDMSKDIPTDRDPSQDDDNLEEEILNQRKTTLDEIEYGKHKEFSETYEQVAWPDKEAPNDTTAEEILAQREQILNEIKEGAQAEMAAAEKMETEGAAINPDTETVVEDVEPEVIVYPDNKGESALNDVNVLNEFGKIGLEKEDLEKIPGLDQLNSVSVNMIAQSMRMLALEKAEKSVRQTVAASFVGKNKVGQFLTGIANSFRQGKIERKAMAEQIEGGLEKHGADLIRLTRWAENFQMNTIERAGKSELDFIMTDLDNMGAHFSPEEKELLEDLNIGARDLSKLPKYWQEKTNEIGGKKLDEKAKEYQTESKWYRGRYNSVLLMLRNKFGDHQVEGIMNKVDARVNMVQFMTANPDLEKEWRAMTKGSSFWGKMRTKENAAFFIGGGASRTLLVGAFGYVAAPLVAAVIGGWRGMMRSEREARKTDRFVDKKEKGGMSRNVYNRKLVLEQINALVPEDQRMSPIVWLKTSTPEDQKKYAKLKLELKVLESKINKEERGVIERKTESADDLMAKTRLIVDKINEAYEAGNFEKRSALLSQLQRRIDYNYRLANKGLVNFGSMEERAEKMVNFYRGIEGDRGYLLGFYNPGEKYEIKYQGKKELKEPIVVEMEKRAEHLLDLFAKSSQIKLDEKRRRFIIKGMIKGATFGAAFAAAGQYAFGHFDHAFDGAVSNAIGGGHSAPAGSLDDAAGNMAGPVAPESIGDGGQTMEGAPTSSESVISSSPETGNMPTDGPEAAVNTSEQATTTESEVASSTEPNIESRVATDAGTSTAAETASSEIAAGSKFSDVITNEGLKGSDSVWRSVKEIFINNSEKLGYTGDVNDSAELGRWASVQTSESLANSGDVTDMVFEGNTVSLEATEDGFAVSVGAGTGAEPDFLPVTEALETEPEVDAAAEEVMDPAAQEAWADQAGARYGLTAEEVSFSDRGVIEAKINGHDVFINPENNTYIYFDEASNECSGMLADASNNAVTDIKGFLAETPNVTSVDSAPVGGEFLLGKIDLSPEGVKVSADNVGRFISEHGAMNVEDLHDQTLEEIQKATGLSQLSEVMTPKEVRIFERLVNEIKDGSYSQALHQKDLSKFIERLVDKHGI